MAMQSRRVILIAGATMLAIAAIPAHAETIQIVIDKLVFSPAEVAAKVGDTIEWVNKDKFVHTATLKGDWEVMLPAGKSVTLVLQEAGSFDYYCRFHPNMKGRLTISAP